MSRTKAGIAALCVSVVMAAGALIAAAATSSPASPAASAQATGPADGPDTFTGFGHQGRNGSPARSRGDGGHGAFPGFGDPAAGPAGPHTAVVAARGDLTGATVYITLLRLFEFLVIVGFLVWAVRATLFFLSARHAPVVQRSAALDELDLLYARGDVKRDDYLARKADLA